MAIFTDNFSVCLGKDAVCTSFYHFCSGEKRGVNQVLQAVFVFELAIFEETKYNYCITTYWI